MKQVLFNLLLAFFIGGGFANAATNTLHDKPLKTAPASTDETYAWDTGTSTLKKTTFAPFLVGDCTGFPCLDGTSDGGNYIKLWAGTGSYWTALQGGSPAANRSWRLPIAAPPSAGTTYLMNMDEYGQMGFLAPSTFLTPTGSGAALTIDASGFDGNLTTGDNTLQEVSQKVDDLIVGGGGCTNLTSFVSQTAWRLFYSDGSGDVKELSLGSDGEYLKSNGAALPPTWATPSGAAHDAVSLGTDADAILGLSTQQITLDSQTANTVFAAPNGSAGDPTFRSLVAADMPTTMATDAEVAAGYQPLDADLTDLADGSLTGSKVGTGVDGGNISTGTVADARIDAAIARDTEVTAAINALPNLAFGTGLTTTSSAGTDTISVTANTYQAYDADWLGVTPNGAAIASAPTYATMRVLLDLEAGVDFYSTSAVDAAFQEAVGPVYLASVSTSTATGNINIDGASSDHYYFNNGSSTATYTPVITSPPASGKERAIVLTVGGGAGIITMTWTNVSFIGTAGATTTTANKYSHYGCFIPSVGNAKCKIIAEASDN